jgi:hypothetical protein
VTSDDITRINIRGISSETVAALNRAAGARGWTQAQYVQRLVRLHGLLRTRLAEPRATLDDVKAILRDLELETVVT